MIVDMTRTDRAWDRFIKRYPDANLADQVRVLLDFIGRHAPTSEFEDYVGGCS